MMKKVYLMVLLFVLSMFLVPNAYALRNYTVVPEPGSCFKKAVPVSGYIVSGGTTAIEWDISDPDCDIGNCGFNTRTLIVNSIKLRRYIIADQPSKSLDPNAVKQVDTSFGYFDANNQWQTYMLITGFTQPTDCAMSVQTNTLSIPTINDAAMVGFGQAIPPLYVAGDYFFTLEFSISARHTNCQCEDHEDEIHNYRGTFEVQYGHAGCTTTRSVAMSGSNNAQTHAAGPCIGTCRWNFSSTITHTGFVGPLIEHTLDGITVSYATALKSYDFTRADPVWPDDKPAQGDPWTINHGARATALVPKEASGKVEDVLGALYGYNAYNIPQHVHSPVSQYTEFEGNGNWWHSLNCQ